MAKKPSSRRTQPLLWNTESLQKIGKEIAKADDPKRIAREQAQQLIENTKRRRLENTILLVSGAVLLVLLIFVGIEIYNNLSPDGPIVTGTSSTPTVSGGGETPTSVPTKIPIVIVPTETIVAEPRPNLQVLIDKSNIPEEFRIDTQFDLIFQISNTGTASAESVFVHYNLPDSLELVASSGQGNCTEQRRSVRCEVGQISAGVEGTSVRSTVKINNDQSDIELTAQNYWVSAATMNDVYGTEPLHLTVVAPRLSRIELTADPSILYISGVLTPTHQTVITATVYDQWDQIYDRETFPVEISAPSESGSFDSASQDLVRGTAVFTFTANGQLGVVKIVATIIDTISSDPFELTIARVTKPEPFIEERVYLTPEDDNLLLTQIPTDWPVEIIGQPQNERYYVAIKLWVVRTLIDPEDHELHLSTISGETVEDQIRYATDKNPETYPSDPFTTWEGNYPRIYQNDLIFQIGIENDDSEKDYVLIRIEGWMPVEQLQPPAE